MKQFKQILFVLIAFFSLYGVSAIVGNGQRPDPSGKGRYTIVTNEIFTQPQYTGPSSLDGLGKKTAGELGLAGKRVYNEYPGGPKLVTLSASAIIFYDTASMEPIYLDGCIVNGKKRPNRLKLEEVVIVEKEKIVEVEKIVEKPVEKIVYQDKIVEKIVEVEKECPECPKDIQVKPFASSKGRFLTGGWLATAVSAGMSCGVSGVLNKNLRDCAIDAGIATVGNRVTQAANPSPDSVRVRVDGKLQSFRKGKEGVIGACELTWEGNEAVVTCGGQECRRVALTSNFNTTVVAIKRGKNSNVPLAPTKSQTINQIPIRTGVATNNGGQIPGGGVPVNTTNGIPTRPTIANPTGGATAPIVPIRPTFGNSLTAGGATAPQSNRATSSTTVSGQQTQQAKTKTGRTITILH